MKFTKLCLTGLIAIATFPGFTAAGKVNQIAIEASTDRPSAIYKCGEEAVFTVTVNDTEGKLVNEGVVKTALTIDGLGKITDQKFDLAKGNPFTISGTLKEPGFLRLTCSFKDDNKTVRKLSAAGYEPLKITPGISEPKDFEQFWKGAVAQLDAQPLDLQLKLIEKSSDGKQNAYQVSFANIDSTRIYGFLSIPKGKGPFPAIITIPGAGPGSNSLVWAKHWGSQGVIGLYMNVHDYSPYVSSKELSDQYKKLQESKSYPFQGAPDRDKYFFKKSILGINRAINYVASRPEFNRKQFVVYGSSQGGAHALILAGLNKNLTASIANVPALCDHGGYLENRNPGWPKLVLHYKKSPECLAMSGYFDAVNFARRVTVPTVICVGFIDNTCSPSSVYAAYNVINAPKKIINELNMGHAFSKGFIQFSDQWIKSQLGLSELIPPSQ